MAGGRTDTTSWQINTEIGVKKETRPEVQIPGIMEVPTED